MINYKKLKKKTTLRTGSWEAPSGAVFPIAIKPHAEKLEILLKNSKNINRHKKVIEIQGNQAMANPKLRPLIEKRLSEFSNPMDVVFKYYDTTEDKELEKIASYQETLLELIINIDMDAVIKKSEILEEIENDKDDTETLGDTLNNEDLSNMNYILELLGDKEEISLWEFYGIKKDDYYSLMLFLITRPDGDYDDCIIRDYEDMLDLSCQIESIKTGIPKHVVMQNKLSFVGDLTKIANLANEKIDNEKVKDDIKEKVKTVSKNGGKKK